MRYAINIHYAQRLLSDIIAKPWFRAENSAWYKISFLKQRIMYGKKTSLAKSIEISWVKSILYPQNWSIWLNSVKSMSSIKQLLSLPLPPPLVSFPFEVMVICLFCTLSFLSCSCYGVGMISCSSWYHIRKILQYFVGIAISVIYCKFLINDIWKRTSLMHWNLEILKYLNRENLLEYVGFHELFLFQISTIA